MSEPSCSHGVSYHSRCSACDGHEAREAAAALELKNSADRENERIRQLRAELVINLASYLARQKDTEALELRNQLLAAGL